MAYLAANVRYNFAWAEVFGITLCRSPLWMIRFPCGPGVSDGFIDRSLMTKRRVYRQVAHDQAKGSADIDLFIAEGAKCAGKPLTKRLNGLFASQGHTRTVAHYHFDVFVGYR